jgi:CRISPR-associated endonuclease Csn1
MAWLEGRYTIRKEVTPDLKLDKVIDDGIKAILKKRLKEFNDKSKDAFANLDKNPIWLNKEKGIKIKRVRITGVSNAEPLHHAKNHINEELKDNHGDSVPTDYVSTGNNHHVAIYKDDKGNLQEEVVSFYEAVTRKNIGLPIINKHHEKGWQFLFTMKQNEMFVFPNGEKDFDPNEIELLYSTKQKLVSENLFRVQKISTKNYMFCNHLHSLAITGDDLKNKKMLSGNIYHFIQTPEKLNKIIKVRLNHLGQIVKIGEY